jgi:HPt (histidine-containing phosphotransfer) domain-containing protein
MGRLDLAERLLANFELRFPKEIEQLEQYLADQNAPRVALLAHQLKGASANMSAPFLEQLLHEIEELARGNSLTDIQEKMCQLQIEWQRFVECRQLTTTRP